MYDAEKVIVGIIVFLVLITFPVWYNVASGKGAAAPELKIGTTETECVESTEFMKASHMQLLDSWRNSVVRDGNRLYASEKGKQFEMSLSRTCLNCHSEKENFCDRCHSYASVSPNCWACHVNPKEIQ